MTSAPPNNKSKELIAITDDAERPTPNENIRNTMPNAIMTRLMAVADLFMNSN